jgi:hypothetical protein
MNQYYTLANSVVTLTGTFHVPLHIEPCRRLEYPYQPTLAVPGMLRPFTVPGYAPTLATGLPSALPAGYLLAQLP